MRYLFILIIVLLIPVSSCFAQNWILIWSDEFNNPGLPDQAKWSYDVGGDGWGNNELQYYTSNRSENARIEDSVLIIEARKENYSGKNYSSARLISKNKGDWLYGRIEVRAMLPVGTGTWPAIWMLPTDKEYGSWPSSGEIDIMEHVGYDPGLIHATVHTDSLNHTKGTQVGESKNISDCSTQFHTYTVEWFENHIDAYVDDEKYFSFDNKNKGYKTWPFDKKFHLLLNIAMGGDWGGAQGVDSAITSARMYIDYVRVYQQAQSGPLSLNVNVLSGGSVDIDPIKTEYLSGDEIRLDATSQIGYEFKSWSGDFNSVLNPLSFTINRNTSVIANFVRIGEMVTNGNFDNGMAQWSEWSNTGTTSESEVKDGMFEIRINQGGVNDWDLQLSQADMNMTGGNKYRISFKASALSERSITVRVAMTVPPHDSWFSKVLSLNSEMTTYSYEFAMPEPGDKDARIEFDFGKSTVTAFIDDISLLDLTKSSNKSFSAFNRAQDFKSGSILSEKQLLIKGRGINNGYNIMGRLIGRKCLQNKTRPVANGIYIAPPDNINNK